MEAVHGRVRARRLGLMVSGLVAWGVAVAAAPATDALPEVTVTGTRGPEPLSRQTNNVTVITAQDIARSTATDVSSLLAAEANLSVQNFYGNDKKTSVDLRGMGDTAVSNVLVIVDGERLNETDLSGADLSTVSLSQVERIEVIRGGGGVRYGHGAVGGVINIITRRPQPGPLSTDALVRAGSYGTRAAQAAARGGDGSLAAQVMFSHLHTEGYRDNGGLASNTVALELRKVPASERGLLDLYVRANLHQDRYGMPGQVSQEAFLGDDRSRRATLRPLDGGVTHDHRLTTGGAVDWGALGKMSLRLSHRDRQDASVIGADPTTVEASRGLINARRDDLQWRHDLSHESGGQVQALTIGLDAQDGRYTRYRNGIAIYGSKLIAGRARTRALFVDTHTSPTQGLNLHVGARRNWFVTNAVHTIHDYPCDYSDLQNVVCSPNLVVVPDAEFTDGPPRRWQNTSAELGAAWTFAPRWTWFGSINRHVRYPNLDELALQAADLRPQQGVTFEQGMRREGPQGFWSLTAFAMKIQDEIYFGKDHASTSESVNRNYDKPTLRQGLELQARWRPHERWSLNGQWAYVRPQFDGLASRLDIPLVPRHHLSAQVAWDARPDLQWTLQARHGGQRVDGNALDDQQSAAPPIAAHTVVDTSWRFQRGAWQWRLIVNNLLDEVYATTAYSGTTYPMPGRSAYLELRLAH